MFDHPENEKARNFINDMLGGPKPDAAPALDPAAPAEPSKPVVAPGRGTHRAGGRQADGEEAGEAARRGL